MNHSSQKKPKLIMTLLVRDEEDIVRQNIEFHLACGVDFIIATDNGSVDKTRDVFDEYRKKGVLHLIDEPGKEFLQAAWNGRMARIAVEKYNADIIFHCDADEFWYPMEGNLKTEIWKSHYDVMAVKVVNVLLENRNGEESFPEDAKYAVVKPFKTSNYEEDTKKQNFYLYRYGTKVIFTTNKGALEVDHGNHSLLDSGKNIYRGISESIKIYHFPLRGKKIFCSKVVDHGKGLETNISLNQHQGFHIRRWFDAYKKGNLDAEYEKLVITKSEAEQLKRKGILEDFSFIKFQLKKDETKHNQEIFYEIRDSLRWKMTEHLYNLFRVITWRK